MDFFYEYIYPLCAFIAFISILGVPFISLSMLSAFIWIPEGCSAIADCYRYRNHEYNKGKPFLGELVAEILKTVIGSIPVVATIITVFFCIGAHCYKIDHMPRVEGTYATILEVKKSIQTEGQNRKVISEIIISIGKGEKKEATLVKDIWDEDKPSVGKKVLVGTRDKKNYYDHFEGCIITDPNLKQ